MLCRGVSEAEPERIPDFIAIAPLTHAPGVACRGHIAHRTSHIAHRTTLSCVAWRLGMSCTGCEPGVGYERWARALDQVPTCRWQGARVRKRSGTNEKRRPGGRRLVFRLVAVSETEAGVLVLELRDAAAGIGQARAATGPGRVDRRVHVERQGVALVPPGRTHGDHRAIGHLDFDEVVIGMEVFFHRSSSLCRGARLGLVGCVFRDPGRLAPARTQVIQLGTADTAATHHGDALDIGRVEREDAFHAFAKRNLADGERSGDTLAVLAADADAFEVLHTGTGAFGHLEADTHSVAGFEIGNFLPEGGNLIRLDLSDNIHRCNSYMLAVCPAKMCASSELLVFDRVRRGARQRSGRRFFSFLLPFVLTTAEETAG